MYATVRPRKAVATVSRGFISSYSCNRGYASYRSLTPAYVLSPRRAGLSNSAVQAPLNYNN